MITKITLINQRSMSWEYNKSRPEYKHMDLCVVGLAGETVWFEKAVALMTRLQSFPDSNIEETIKEFFESNYEIKKKTKKYRVYFIFGGLYIHEED